VLRKKAYNLIISSSEEDQELERRGIDQLLARRVDALILASSETDAGSLRHLEQQGTPYILIDRRPAGLKTNFIGVDDEEIGILATGHLIDVGCRRIAHISGPAISTALGRLKGYQRALQRHGMSVDPQYIITRDRGDEESDCSGYAAMKKLLALERPPDGVFCYNDPTAMGAMEAALEQGLGIPRDLAVVGAGNVRYAKFLRMPLTTIDQQCEDIGDRAGKLALRLIESKSAPKLQTILLKPRLVVRESSAKRPT
jgi:LacI family transcriptional regulator